MSGHVRLDTVLKCDANLYISKAIVRQSTLASGRVGCACT